MSATADERQERLTFDAWKQSVYETLTQNHGGRQVADAFAAALQDTLGAPAYQEARMARIVRRAEPELPAEVLRVVVAARPITRAYKQGNTITFEVTAREFIELGEALDDYDRWLAGEERER